MRKLFKAIYRLRVRRPHLAVDRLRYLKRLSRAGKHPEDEWYYSDKDAYQYRPGEVLICSRFRGVSVMFFCDPGVRVESQIIRGGLFTLSILNRLADLAQPGTLVLDVGGNIGAYAIPLAKADPSIEVHAFEPNPHAITRFKRNLRLNRVSNVRLHEIALGDRRTQLTLHAFARQDLEISSFIAPSLSENAPELIDVEVVPLDELYREERRPISVIKMDVQGFEREVMMGARVLVATHRPAILFEHEDHNFTSTAQAEQAKRDLARFFKEHGYGVFYITRHDPDLLFPVAWERPLLGDLLALPDADGVFAAG